MDLKKLFPISYKKSFVVGLIIYLIQGIIAAFVIGFAGAITGWIPIVGTVMGWVLGIASILVEIYVVGGIIVSILRVLKVIK